MKYNIEGDDFQVIEFELEPGETLFAESGAMFWKDPCINMEATAGGKGFFDGLIKAVARKLSGESLMLVKFEAHGSTGRVALAPPAMGKLIVAEVKPGYSLIAQRGAYFAHVGELDISIAFTKRLTAGIFGGEGFVLQRLSGNATVVLYAAGYIKELNLEAGQTVQIDTGCIVGFEDRVSYSVTLVKNIKTWLFGGEGALLATLTGPGKVWLQSLPISTFAAYLSRFLPIETRS